MLVTSTRLLPVVHETTWDCQGGNVKTEELQDLGLDDDNFIMALARGLVVLQAFSHKWKHLSMSQISHLTGIPRASVGRCLHTLWKLGYVGTDENQRYFLRPQVLQLSYAYTSSNHLLALVQPSLDRLAEELGEACSFAVVDGEEIVYLARGLSSRIMALEFNVGGRAPLWCSAIGLLALAKFDECALNEYLENTHFVRHTEHTIVDPERLRQALITVRDQGYSISSRQSNPRFDAIAVPLHNESGAVFGGVSILIRSGSIPREQLSQRFLTRLRQTVSQLEVLFAERYHP